MTINSINEIKKIHVEITSRCNAACPGCARQDEKTGKPLSFLKKNKVDWSLEDFKKIFPKDIVKDKKFEFGVVVDEPFMNPNIVSIVAYLLESGVNGVDINTNGGVGSAETWNDIGKLSSLYPNSMTITFSVDGFENTNHIYRVNVKWKKVLQNMKIFTSHNAKSAKWDYLVFDHNEDDIELANNLANELGIEFKVRANTRNIKSWNTFATVKENGKIVERKYKVEPSTNKKFEHSDTEKVKEYFNKDRTISTEELDNIRCMMLDRKEIFVDFSKRLWPCCWWGTVYWIDHDKFMDNGINKLYGHSWNDLGIHSIDDVLQHKYYQLDLSGEARYNDESPLYSGKMCYKQCGDCGSRHGYEFFDKDGKTLQ